MQSNSVQQLPMQHQSAIHIEGKTASSHLLRKRISVALPVVLDTLFDYYIECDEYEELVGRRVLVPFGTSRQLIGVILQQSDDLSSPLNSGQNTNTNQNSNSNRNTNSNHYSNDKIKSAIKLIDNEAIFNDKMIKFLKWIADYYIAPIGEVFRAAAPSTERQELNQIIKLINDDYEYLDNTLAKSKSLLHIVQILIENNSKISLAKLKKNIPGNARLKILKLQELGIIEILDAEYKAKSIKKSHFVKINPELFSEKSILADEIKNMEKKTPKRAELLKHLLESNTENHFVEVPELITESGITINIIKALIKSEFLEETYIDYRRVDDTEFKLASKKEVLLPLSEEQNSVYNSILEKYRSNNHKPSLIYGVTGSGKTLIYMNMIREVINKGQSSIILLPEISLTPQFIDRFELSFPGEISVLHSRMPSGEREQSYRDILSGKSKIIIGARSALFAPAQNLGLIIVDEEHDSSFKQESPNPRYNGRDAAVMRAKIEDVAIILGSATPSMESMHNAQNGKYDLYQILNRADKAKLPKINVIDMLDATRQGQVYNFLSKSFLNEIAKRISKKEGVILLQNRRGFASVVQCKDCGHIHQCVNCSVTLTYHKYENRNKCHYCDYSEPMHQCCMNCGSVNLAITGSGTQKVEEDIANYFHENNSECKIERMDFDTTSKQGAHRKILERFSKGATDILIGTQMVAKGLDFERVTMVGIVNSDIQLMIPDFRANERSFQLLTQVSGRAGRSSEREGEVFIQTSMPDNPAIKSVISSSYFQFYNDEISSREAAAYPPFSRFNIIEFSSEDKELAAQHCQLFFNLLPTHNSLIIHNPVAPFIEKIRDYYRQIIVIKSIKEIDTTGKILHHAIKMAHNQYLEKFASPKVRIKIDIDANSGT